MSRKLRWVGLMLSGLLLAACGGGDSAPTDLHEQHAQAAPAAAKSPAAKPAAKQRASKAPQRMVATLTPAELFEWAAAHYPALFNGASITGFAPVNGYGNVQYSYWPATQNYLGISDGQLYFYGRDSGLQIQLVGSMTSLACVVYDCTAGGSAVQLGAALAIGSSVTGATSVEGVTVVHQVWLTAGTTYRFDLTSTAADPKLWLYSGTTQIDENDDINYPTDINSRISFTPEITGTYSLRVGFFEGFGAYTLSGAIATGDDGGGVNWNSPYSATELVATTQTLALSGRWGQAFTLSDETPVEVIFAARTNATLYVTTGASLANCVAGRSFTQLSQYTLLKSGYKAFTLAAGSYGICIRNTTAGTNEVRVEVQAQPTVTGFHYEQDRFVPVVSTVQPGGRFTQAATAGDSYRVILDGANTGGTFWYIPASEQAAFLAGETFLYYDDAFGCGSGRDAPGLCELTGIGDYMIAYHNNTDKAQAIVLIGRDYVPD